MKKYSIFPIVLISSLLLVACGNKEQTAEPIKTDRTETPKKVKTTSTSKDDPKKTDKKVTSPTDKNNKKRKTTTPDKPNQTTIEPEDSPIQQELTDTNEPTQINESPEEMTELSSPPIAPPVDDISSTTESPQNNWVQEDNTTIQTPPSATMTSEENWGNSPTETMPYYGEDAELDTQMSEYHVPYDVETNQYLDVPMDEAAISFRQAWINDQIEWAKEKGYDTQSFTN